jgi:hypothetical protein
MNSFVANLGRNMWRPMVLAVAGAVALCATETVRAQTVDQRLDSITVFGQGDVGAGVIAGKARGVVQTPTLKQVYYSADPLFPTVEIPLQGTHTLRACQGTGTRGLYCLDYNPAGGASAVLRWQNPDKDPAPQVEVACTDLGLVDCTAMTVNLRGHLFVAGQKTAGNATSYSLFKLIERVGDPLSCPGQDEETDAIWTTVGSGKYCAREYASSRPRIYDLKMIDAELSGWFQGEGLGVLAAEETNQVTFYADRQPLVAPIVYLTPQKWGNTLGTGETLQGISLLQVASANPVRNFILGATSLGRVVGYEIPWSGNKKTFYTGLTLNSTTLAVPTGDPVCTAAAPFDVSTSARTRRTFFTSGSCVAGFDPTIANNLNAQVPVTFTKRFSLAVESSFALSGVAVSPGIEIDFLRDGCTTLTGCNLISTDTNNNNVAAAKFARISLGTDATGWVMYLATGFTDCRYADPKPATCTPASIVDPTGSGDPTKQYLNIIPQMPPEITQAIALPEKLLLQPEYHARPTSPGRPPWSFDALFGVPELGLTYRDTFDGLFDVFDLFGSALGCGGGTITANSKFAPPVDMVVNISELAPTVGGPVAVTFPEGNPPATVPREFVSVLLNKGCTNPTALAGTRGSGFFYGLQRAPQAKDANGNWIWYDSTFALLMRSLARDFDTNLYTYTCRNLDAPAGSLAPLSDATCYQLKKDWVVTYDKLKKCVNATDQPKNSSGNEACGSFETQWMPFLAEVAAVTLQTDAPDPQNRVGGVKNAALVMDYVYRSLFLTSLKKGGFTNPN